MDISVLQSQYNDYWNSHNLPAVILNLNEIYSYISQGNNDFSLTTPNNVLTIPFLYYLYQAETGNNSDVTYSDLISWYSGYLQNFINQIVDTQKQIAALTAKSNLDNLFGAISDALSFFTSPVFWILIAVIIIGVIILKIV